MGIRIHKVIGYGIDNVELDHGNIIDDRFYNQSAFMMEYGDNPIRGGHYESPEDIYTKDGFLKYLKTHTEAPHIEAHMLKTAKWDFYHSFIREWEGEHNNVFLVIPPGNDDWFRYDNIIDYIEEGKGRNGDRLEKLQQGIWPYDSVHQNQNGDRLKPLDSCMWWRLQNNVIDGDYNQEDLQSVIVWQEMLSRKLGFKNYHDALDNIAPYVPDVVRAFCHYTNIFNDPETVNELRPMLFIYWS